MWGFLTGLFSGPLNRIFQTIDTAISNETTREQVKADVAKTYLTAQVSVLTGPGWFFPLFFLIPAGMWFSSVVLYSMLFCKACAFPQAWTIAALPAPLNDWMAAIVGSLFIGKAGEQIIAKLR